MLAQPEAPYYNWIGRVYVMTHSGTDWRVQQILTSPASDSQFGLHIAIDNDIACITSSSMVHIFRRIGTTWTWEQSIARPVEAYYFEPVAVDIHDGIIAVGTSSYLGSDYVYIFEHINNEWTLKTLITPPLPNSNLTFGVQVAVHDGTVVVGTRANPPPHLPGKTIRLGMVYIYQDVSGWWSLQDTIWHPEPFEYDDFGTSLDIHSGRVVIGAPLQSTESGAAYIFDKVGSDYVLSEKIHSPSITQTLARYGDSIYMDDEYITIGEPNRFTSINNERGSVHIYTNNHPAPLLENSIHATEHTIGRSVAFDLGYLFVSARYAYRPFGCPANIIAFGQPSQSVNGQDLGVLLANWHEPGITDFNNDGTTNGFDLGTLLSQWGPCP
ncbi:MAG: hypothetical protein ACF8GE_07640 [Phycisphaerales bacterium JB043]